LGYQAGYSQVGTGGDYNTLLGFKAGYTNATGTQNTYIGVNSGYLTTSSYNTFVGLEAGYYITTGAKNTILGKYNGYQGGLDIRTASNYIVLSDGDGNPLAYTQNGKTFVLPSGTISSGTGIAFPATQNPSSDATTLDDYEKGTWTAVISTESGSNYTITSQTSRYVKIGNSVTVNASIIYSAVGSGTVSYVSLPFLPAQSPVAISFSGTINGTSGGNYLTDLSLFTYANAALILRVSNVNTYYYSGTSSWASSGTFTFCGTFIV
jgi:hypothetical protein